MSKADPTYAGGFEDGLRAAVEILRGLEETMAKRLERPASSRWVREQRRTRVQAYRVAQTRITTHLKARQRQPSLPATIKDLAL